MTLTNDEIKAKITQFISVNPACRVRTMSLGLARQLGVSNTRIFKLYKTMIYDKKKNPNGLIIVEKPKGFRGGNEPFSLSLRQTDLKKEIDQTMKELETYEKQFHTYFPNIRKNKLLTWKKIENGKYQFIKKAFVNDFETLCLFLDMIYVKASGYGMAKTLGYTPKEYDSIIDNIQKRTMKFIIKEIDYFLNQQSKTDSVTRWNTLMQFRTRLDWLLNIETKKPDLFIKKKWLKEGVIF